MDTVYRCVSRRPVQIFLLEAALLLAIVGCVPNSRSEPSAPSTNGSVEAEPPGAIVEPPPVDRAEPTQGDVFQLRGVRLGMTADEVKALLGQPDEIKDVDVRSTWFTWIYAQEGLRIDVAKSQASAEPMTVQWAMQSRGAHPSGLRIGDPQELAERMFGPAIVPEGEGYLRTQFKDSNGNVFEVVIEDGKVSDFILSAPFVP